MRGDDDMHRDELADRRAERDAEREPRSWRRTRPDHRARQAFQARQVELAAAAVGRSITALECPSCCGPLFAPADSVDEQIGCPGCGARLVTAQTREGVVAILRPDGAP